MNSIQFYEYIPKIIELNILNSNTGLITSKKQTKTSRKLHKMYSNLIKNYRILGLLPFKAIKIFKIKNKPLLN